MEIFLLHYVLSNILYVIAQHWWLVSCHIAYTKFITPYLEQGYTYIIHVYTYMLTYIIVVNIHTLYTYLNQ